MMHHFRSIFNIYLFFTGKFEGKFEGKFIGKFQENSFHAVIKIWFNLRAELQCLNLIRVSFLPMASHTFIFLSGKIPTILISQLSTRWLSLAMLRICENPSTKSQNKSMAILKRHKCVVSLVVTHLWEKSSWVFPVIFLFCLFSATPHSSQSFLIPLRPFAGFAEGNKAFFLFASIRRCD